MESLMVTSNESLVSRMNARALRAGAQVSGYFNLVLLLDNAHPMKCKICVPISSMHTHYFMEIIPFVY